MSKYTETMSVIATMEEAREAIAKEAAEKLKAWSQISSDLACKQLVRVEDLTPLEMEMFTSQLEFVSTKDLMLTLAYRNVMQNLSIMQGLMAMNKEKFEEAFLNETTTYQKIQMQTIRVLMGLKPDEE
jgi:hypothetical protein